jgi:S-adenosyl methyltransferase
VYDYWLGGKDNFLADRALAELMIGAIPNMRPWRPPTAPS